MTFYHRPHYVDDRKYYFDRRKQQDTTETPESELMLLATRETRHDDHEMRSRGPSPEPRLRLRSPLPMKRSRTPRPPTPRAIVLVKHWSGWIGQGVSDELKIDIEDNFDDVAFEERKGPANSFEVYINGQLLFSRRRTGGYPFVDDVLTAVNRARHGMDFREIRTGNSCVCSIL